jgi:hypothetical protein
MALARIITRSHQCSRELALDLLARGYTVEIVSPDKIPDSLADLELRVDAGSEDQLIASVEAHNGERSASLEFVHHLKAPMGDFVRRTPEPGEAFLTTEEPVRFNAEPDVQDVELPAKSPQLAARIISPPVEIRVDAECDSADVACPNLSPGLLPTPTVEPPIHFAGPSTIVNPITEPARAESTVVESTISKPIIDSPSVDPFSFEPAIAAPEGRPFGQRRNRSFGWRWPAVATFSGVLLLALMLGFGLRRTGKVATEISEVTPADKVLAASPDMNLSSTPDRESDRGSNPAADPRKNLGSVAHSAGPMPLIKSGADSNYALQGSRVAPPETSVVGTRVAKTLIAAKPRVAPRHHDELIARDTVTYLDQRYKPAPKPKPSKHVAHQRPGSHGRGGIVAANSVTYLNPDPAPKTPK